MLMLDSYKWMIAHVTGMHVHAKKLIYVPWKYQSVYVPGPLTDSGIDEWYFMRNLDVYDPKIVLMEHLIKGIKFGYEIESGILLIAVQEADW